MRVLMGSVLVFLCSCSLIEVKQDPFPPLEVQAERPPQKPPRVVLTDSSIVIKDKVMFETGSATILEQSHSLLHEVAGMLTDNPQIELMDVEGHTDSQGGASMNKRLSKDRAKSVVAFLIKSGVKKSRLQAKGYGPDRPVADNETEQGRDQNRRVEFTIVKQGQKKILVQDED